MKCRLAASTHLRVDFDGSDVRLFVDVFDVSFIDVAVMHLDLQGEKRPRRERKACPVMVVMMGILIMDGIDLRP